jgi:phenylacetate-CoA ligase
VLKELAWESLATIAGSSYRKEYNTALPSNASVFLRNLLLHAYDNVPYYHRVLRKSGVIENGKLCLANFGRIPILTRKTIKEREGDLFSRDGEKRKWFYNTSSGSTGEPVRFIQDRLFLKWGRITSRYYYERMLGVNEAFAKKVLLWAARDLFRENFGFKEIVARRINDVLTNTVLLNCTYMTETDMEHYVRMINSYKPEIIRGYASALYEICRFVEKRNLAIFKPTIVVSSAEMLRDVFRKKIENIFGARVYDVYGSRELDGIAGECKHGLLHIFMFNNYVEVMDGNNSEVREGENGKVVATALHNYSMPFIRYEIGDMAIVGPNTCKCGNPLPTLAKITGRVSCFFRKANGTLIDDGYFMAILAQREWIRAFKIIQEDYEKIRVMVVSIEGIIPNSEKKSIEEGIKLVMGKDCKVIWEVVDEIPKTKMGKYLYTQCLLSE